MTILGLVAAVLFILALRGLSSASTSLSGNRFGMLGMGLAVALPFLAGDELPWAVAATIAVGGTVGFFIAKKIDMTALPQLLAAFHSLVGLAAVFIAGAICATPEAFCVATVADRIPLANAIEMSLGAAIGAITFSGSLVAFGKLQGILSGKPLRYPGQHKVNLFVALAIAALIATFVHQQSVEYLVCAVLLAFLIGFLLIMPVGGADMPVIVSMLNSYSGWATAGIGFTLENEMLIIVGALVGTSGAILSNIMCKGMNRSLLNVVFGGLSGNNAASTAQSGAHGNVKLCSAEDAGFIIKNASSVIIVPGYGMAVAQAQHVLKELTDALKVEGISVKYAIHPVAGRMPGHMNVLLAEANIPYEDVFELDDINHEFGSTDVAIVIGANDITNPAAKDDPNSPIYGMPVLDVEKAKTVLFVKRSLGAGYAGIENALFFRDNTMMLLGDAQKVCENILKAIKG